MCGESRLEIKDKEFYIKIGYDSRIGIFSKEIDISYNRGSLHEDKNNKNRHKIIQILKEYSSEELANLIVSFVDNGEEWE